MIKHFSSIKNAGIFHDYTWKSGAGIPDFDAISVIYGHNYSGKTTLSRIIRALETNEIPQNYDGLKFSIELESEVITETTDFKDLPFIPKVYNEDFVRTHLKFFSEAKSPLSESFTVLGESNVAIEKELKQIEEELGSNAIQNETGLYKELAEAREKYNSKKKEYELFSKNLSDRFTKKGADIKRKTDRYGSSIVNYNKNKLEDDIKSVLDKSYSPPMEADIRKFERQIEEKEKNSIRKLICSIPNFYEVANKCKALCEKRIGSSKPIQELIYNTAMASWVNAGLEINNERDTCAFCGNPISKERWEDLYAHFNKEAQELQSEIEQQLAEIEALSNSNMPTDLTSSNFYADYSDEASKLIIDFKQLEEKYFKGLRLLSDLLQERKATIVTPIEFNIDQEFLSLSFSDIVASINDLIDKNNAFSRNISTVKEHARKMLRLCEVNNFQHDIRYTELKLQEQALEEGSNKTLSELNEITSLVHSKEEIYSQKKNSLVDNKAGARIVNKLLKKAMPSTPLHLVPVDSPEEPSGVVFAINRGDAPAYNMSEGERNLISFCYFLASLCDGLTSSSKRLILWIDDPVSSLDQNNIFATYSLIEDSLKSLFVDNRLEQVFITTHSLLFLRYLKTLKVKDKTKVCFVVQRQGGSSNIEKMPLYIEREGTEFNYWFKNIVICASCEICDANEFWYESFANNARKFFEFELYFKYPYRKSHKDPGEDALRLFWDGNEIPRILTQKLINEYSHSISDIDNESIVVQAPEIHEAAKAMLTQLKKVDGAQYAALLKSISMEDPL